MQTIRTTPAYEPPFALHDGDGGREWYFTVEGVTHGPHDTEALADAEYHRVAKAVREGDL